MNFTGLPSASVTSTTIEAGSARRSAGSFATRNVSPPVFTTGAYAGSGAFDVAVPTCRSCQSWKLRGPSRRPDRCRPARGSGPARGSVTGSASRPLAGTGGCLWMIDERSSRTMITCTPVCGPAPVRNFVSTFPSGVRTASRSVTFPGAATVCGPCQSSVYSFAGATVGGAGEPPPPPQAAAREPERRPAPRRAATPHWPSGKR